MSTENVRRWIGLDVPSDSHAYARMNRKSFGRQIFFSVSKVLLLSFGFSAQTNTLTWFHIENTYARFIQRDETDLLCAPCSLLWATRQQHAAFAVQAEFIGFNEMLCWPSSSASIDINYVCQRNNKRRDYLHLCMSPTLMGAKLQTERAHINKMTWRRHDARFGIAFIVSTRPRYIFRRWFRGRVREKWTRRNYFWNFFLCCYLILFLYIFMLNNNSDNNNNYRIRLSKTRLNDLLFLILFLLLLSFRNTYTIFIKIERVSNEKHNWSKHIRIEWKFHCESESCDPQYSELNSEKHRNTQ